MPQPLQRATNSPSHRLRSVALAGLVVAALGAAAPVTAQALIPAAAPSTTEAGQVEPTGSLGQAVNDPSKHDAVVDELDTAISQTADEQGGVGKRGLSLLESSSPGATRTLLDRQLVSYANALQPQWDAYTSSGASGGFGAYLSQRAPEVSDALLGVSDQFAADAKSAPARVTYQLARSGAKDDIAASLPQIGSIMEKYAR